jgi:hypothetical protein
MKKDMLGKALVLGVICLFVGVGVNPAFATVHPGDKNVNYINITSEFTGLNRKHTVKMTQKEIDEFYAYFDSIYEKLNNTESNEETSLIINEAILKLDRYDLLCGLSVEQVQKRFSEYNKLNGEIITNHISAKENSDCLVVGRAFRVYFIHPIIIWLDKLIEEKYPDTILSPLMFIYKLLLQLRVTYGFPYFPIKMNTSIALGYYSLDMFDGGNKPSVGWLMTIGSNGTKGWIGRFRGHLKYFWGLDNKYYIGVEGFIGFRISNPLTLMTSILGFANKVKIDNF